MAVNITQTDNSTLNEALMTFVDTNTTIMIERLPIIMTLFLLVLVIALVKIYKCKDRRVNRLTERPRLDTSNGETLDMVQADS